MVLTKQKILDFQNLSTLQKKSIFLKHWTATYNDEKQVFILVKSELQQILPNNFNTYFWDINFNRPCLNYETIKKQLKLTEIFNLIIKELNIKILINDEYVYIQISRNNIPQYGELIFKN